MTQFTLSAGTQTAIATAIASPGTNNINYYNAYTAIYNDLVANGAVNSGTVSWFSQAGNVNRQQYVSSAAGTYIWDFTQAAVANEGGSVNTSQMQTASNTIATTVFKSLQNNSYVFSDSTSSTINFAPATIVGVDAGAGFGVIQTDNSGVALDDAAWGGSLFARTMLQDSTFFADNHLGVTPGTKDCDAMLAGFYSAAIGELNGGYGVSAVLNILNGNLDAQALGICMGPVTTATLGSPTVTASSTGSNTYSIGFGGTYSDGSVLASSAAYNATSKTWTTTATDTTSTGYEFNQNVLTDTTTGLTSDDKGLNTTGGVTYEQVTTTPTNGSTSATISGVGDTTNLSNAAITLGSAVQATVDGVSNAITAAANAVLTLAAGSSSNTVTATGAATVDDSGASDSTTAANGSTVNIQGTSGNADSVAMNYGTLNLGTDVVGNLSGQHDTVNVQAASDANTGGTSLTVNMLGAGSTLVDTGTNDLDTVDAANITAYLQGAGSSVTANSASDGLVLQANNQTGTLQGAGGSITAYGNTSAIIMDGSGETGSMYGSNGAITVYGASDGSYMTGVNDTDALMGGNDGAIVQNHNDGVYDYSTGSGAAITNSDLGSWITGTFTTGGETVGVNASINSNGTITYSESSSGNYAHTAGGTVSLASDVMVNDGSYFANTLNSASAGSVTDLYNVSSTISENDLNYTGLNDTGLLSGETIDRVSLPTLSLTFQYSGTTEEYFTMSEAGVGTAIFADNGAFESGTGALASLGGYGSGDGGGSDDGYGGDGFSGDEGEFEIANTSNMTTTGSGGASINFSTFNSALPQSSAALNESNVAENEINTIKQLAASGFNTDQAFYEGGRWAPGTTITWSMATLAGPDASPFSSYMGPQYTALVQQAFSEWAAASGLTFTQVADSAQSDIRVGFGDFNTAQSGVTGYTTYQYKDSLLQPDVIVRVEDPTQTALSGSGANATYSGTNSAIYQDILHEIGHALGLADNNDPNSVMYYQAGASNVTLDANDITGLQTLYEANSPLAPSASLGDEISVNSMVHQMTQANASYLATSSVGIAAASAATAEAQQTTLAANAAH